MTFGRPKLLTTFEQVNSFLSPALWETNYFFSNERWLSLLDGVQKYFTCFVLGLSIVLTALAQAQLSPVPLAPANWDDDGIPTLIYDTAAGNLNIDFDDVRVTTLEIRTTGADFFTGDKPASNDNLFHVFRPTMYFKLDPAGFSSVVELNAVTGLGVGVAELLVVNGSRLGGGNIAPVDLVVVPEPNSIMLLSLGGLALLTRRRK